MKWDAEHGIWSLLDSRVLKIRGTTPRNADCWSIDVDFPGPDVEFGLDVDLRSRYVRFSYWPQDRYHEFVLGKHNAHRKFPFANYCACARQDWSYRETWLQKIRGPR